MPKIEIEMPAADHLARLQEGDRVKRVLNGFAPAVVIIEREVKFELPTIMGCVLLVDRASRNMAPLVVQDMTGINHKPERHWAATNGMKYADDEVLGFAEQYGNLKTVYVPAM